MEKLEENAMGLKSVAIEFYFALQAMFIGDTAPMEKLWSHADDVTYLGPQGEILKGWKQVEKAWKDQGDLKLNGKVEPGELHILLEGNIGIIQNYEIGTNYKNGKVETVRIRSTKVFRKENEKWKMITLQADLLSFLE